MAAVGRAEGDVQGAEEGVGAGGQGREGERQRPSGAAQRCRIPVSSNVSPLRRTVTVTLSPGRLSLMTRRIVS